MGTGETHRGSFEAPVVFPATLWLKDGTIYDEFLESCQKHLSAQETEATLLPPYLTSTVTDEEFASTPQMKLITPKLNEVIGACPEEATHIWFLNADAEVPTDALERLLKLGVDVASGISPSHRSKYWSTVFHWVPPPTPQENWSTPYFRVLRMNEVQGIVIGGCELIGTGHFCMLVRKHVFDNFRFRWNPPKQKIGSELTFWMDAQMLGYKCRIDGRLLVGHLPEHPLEELV